MSDKSELSLQSLYELIQTKADKTHTHTFIGSIESALSLQGVTYDRFMRNDLKDQKLKAKFDSVTLGIESNDTTFTIKSEHNRATIEVDNHNLSRHNLHITGKRNLDNTVEDVVVSIQGNLLVNNTRVLTMDNKNELTGIKLDDLDIAGQGIIVQTTEPSNTKDGTIWGKIIDNDTVIDDTAIANHNMYTIPVGTIVKTLSNVVPNGYIRLNGQVVSRSTYNGLWEWVKAKSVIIPDADWKTKYTSNKNVQAFSYGDGSTNFRVPNIPTNDSTMYMIKGYDELTNREAVNLTEIEKRTKRLEDSAVVTGVGFIKYADGNIVQYNKIMNQTTIYFSTPFINTDYILIANYVGTSVGGITVNVESKTVNSAKLAVRTNTGAEINYPAMINFIAIGRWK